MKKHQLIKTAHALYKVAYQPMGIPAPETNPYTPQTWGAMDTAMAGLTATGLTPQGINYSKNVYNPAAATSTTRLGTAGRFLGKAALPLSVGFAGYGVASSGGAMAQDYGNSGFAGQGLTGVRNYLGTSGGLNRLADTTQAGSLTLAGAGIGAGIGSFGFGVGALPGALIGATIGGAAELGMGAYRTATGWDGDKYQLAKNMQQGASNPAAAFASVQAGLNNKSGRPVFKNKTWFGFGKDRDLMQEASDDVDKERAFKNKYTPIGTPQPPA